MQPDSTFLDNIPGINLLTQILQQNIQINLNKKTVRSGKLILFKRTHYYIHITLQNNKESLDNYEVPIPFQVEYYPENGLIYFDYRVITLAKKNKEIATKLSNYRDYAVKSPSSFYDKILEIVVLK